LRPIETWFEPLETRRFAEVGNLAYETSLIVAVLLSFGIGYIGGETIGFLSITASPLVWLLGAAIRYKLTGIFIRPPNAQSGG